MTQPHILFVDDEPHVLKAYQRTLRGLRDEWSMQFDVCPLAAMDRMRAKAFDTIVSDMRMPGMTGLELLQEMKQDSQLRDVPVVIVTGDGDKRLKRAALDLGAADLLNKPVEADDLIARLRSSLRTKRYADELKRSNALLEQRVQARTAELAASRVDIIWRLGKAAECRDEETGNHVIRVGCFSHAVAKALGMSDDFCDTLFLAAPLHDIGKIGISDSILLKPGKLTDDEWVQMRMHCEIGASILSDRCKLTPVANRFGCRLVDRKHDGAPNPVIEMAATISLSHHERWDGSGYPQGISGKAIPLVGRIVAIADVFDALRSRRSYKEPFDIDRAVAILTLESGAHFDPAIVDAFRQALPEIRGIDEEFRDESMDIESCISASFETSHGFSR